MQYADCILGRISLIPPVANCGRISGVDAEPAAQPGTGGSAAGGEWRRGVALVGGK